MFASGVVKLTSLCPTWWGLTAMPTHYFSQVYLIFQMNIFPTAQVHNKCKIPFLFLHFCF